MYNIVYTPKSFIWPGISFHSSRKIIYNNVEKIFIKNPLKVVFYEENLSFKIKSLKTEEKLLPPKLRTFPNCFSLFDILRIKPSHKIIPKGGKRKWNKYEIWPDIYFDQIRVKNNFHDQLNKSRLRNIHQLNLKKAKIFHKTCWTYKIMWSRKIIMRLGFF